MVTTRVDVMYQSDEFFWESIIDSIVESHVVADGYIVVSRGV